MKTDSHSPSWTLAVTAAITWNLIITILKFIWYLASWSWSLFSESIHSLADTLNQLLLMVWIKRSNKKADNNYSYWYKRDIFGQLFQLVEYFSYEHELLFIIE